MNKPRLAEILGVEVDEVFTLRGDEGKKCAVDGCGIFYVNGTSEPRDFYDLMYIINNPEVIVRKPKSRWTKKDVENAKAIHQVMPWVRYVWRDMFRGMYPSDNDTQLLVHGGCFPSIAEGETIKIDEILNAEVQQ